MIRRLLGLIVLLGLLAGGLWYWKLRGEGVRPDALGSVAALKDAKLTWAVKAALGLHRSLKPYTLEVGVEEGVVTLRGELPRDTLKSVAERTAAAVPGVSQVVSHIRIRPGTEAPDEPGRSLGESLDDTALALQVRLALSLNRDLAGTDIHVAAFRREVTLSGEVATPGQRKLAADLAHDTAGVAGLKDQLRVRGQSPTP